MHSRFQDLVPVHLKDEGDPELERPSEEDIEEVQFNLFAVCYDAYSLLSDVVIITITFSFDSYRHNIVPVEFCGVEPQQ